MQHGLSGGGSRGPCFHVAGLTYLPLENELVSRQAQDEDQR